MPYALHVLLEKIKKIDACALGYVDYLVLQKRERKPPSLSINFWASVISLRPTNLAVESSDTTIAFPFLFVKLFFSGKTMAPMTEEVRSRRRVRFSATKDDEREEER